MREITHHTIRLLQTPVPTHHALRITYGYYEFFIPDDLQIGIGDTLFLECTSGAQDQFMTDRNNGYIRLICRVKTHKKLEKHSGIYSIYTIVWILDQLRGRLLSICFSAIPEPHASLLAGILLGYQASLPREFHQQLLIVGMLHVVAASGYNVTWIAHISSSIFRRVLSKKKNLLISMSIVAAYTIMAGCSPSVLRAAIMEILALTASYSGRIYSAGYAFMITCLCMLIVNPSYLFSVSFQLSVSATAGIIWLSPLFTRGKKQNEVESTFTTTLAATLTTLPITVTTFGQLSLISLVANTVILWLVPYIMSIGVLFLSISLFSSSMGRALGIVAWVPLDVFTRGIRVLSGIPFASIQGIHLSYGWIWVWWGMLAGICIYKKRRKSEKNLLKYAKIGRKCAVST